ncbi:ATP-binding cassette domain-containing protein [Rhodococcus hoagii]|nr:ATP-binding cassette domain-containing protein [Prescottella equi]
MNPPSLDHAVAVTGLHKAFGERTVLGGVDLHVPTGTVFALLGANGAGKTNTVRVLSTLLPFDAGEVRVAGHALPSQARAVRADISVTGQYARSTKLSTGREKPRPDGRTPSPRSPRSSGPRRRTAAPVRPRRRRRPPRRHVFGRHAAAPRLAMSLVARPKVLFLDEPTTGLDPRSRRDMWDMVRELVREGTTILLTTQYLDEADALADRIAVLDGGRIVAEGVGRRTERLVPAVMSTAAPGRHAGRGGRRRSARGGRRLRDGDTHDPTDGSIGSLGRILDRLDDQTLSVERFALHTPDLDDVFFALTGSDEKEEVR